MIVPAHPADAFELRVLPQARLTILKISVRLKAIPVVNSISCGHCRHVLLSTY
jgi:hypothetical protein